MYHIEYILTFFIAKDLLPQSIKTRHTRARFRRELAQ